MTWICPCRQVLDGHVHDVHQYDGAVDVLELATCPACRTTRARRIPLPGWRACSCGGCREARRARADRAALSLLREPRNVGEEFARARARRRRRMEAA